MKTDAMSKAPRESSLELLRIICMCMIVLAHYASHGGLLLSGYHTPLALLMRTGGKSGAICFVLISAYFMANGNFKPETLLRTVFQAVFYSAVMWLLAYFLGYSKGFSSIARIPLCVFLGDYWFVTAYVGLYAVSPVLNFFLNRIDRNQHRSLIVFLFLLLSVIPTLLGAPTFIVNNFVYFVFLYFCGAYIRKYEINARKCTIMGIASFILIPSLTFAAMHVIKSDELTISGEVFWLYSTNSSFMLLIAVGMFITFSKLKFSNRFVNYVASITFAVYLLHDNSGYRSMIWDRIFRTEQFYSSSAFVVIGHALLCMVSLFVCAAIIEWIRKLGEKWLFRSSVMGKLCQSINVWGEIWK